MLRRHPLVVLAFLILAAFACSSLPVPPDPDQPPVIRRNQECSDERFKNAEQAAYEVLVQARADAARARDELISSGERLYNRDKQQANDAYQNALNSCHDANCTLSAKQSYDNAIADAQKYQNRRIDAARSEEAAALAEAQAKYDAAVEKAKELYCTPAYKASGQAEGATYSGVICDLEKPFAITVTSAYYEFTIQFAPASSKAGAMTYTGTWFDVGPMSGDGPYSVQYVGDVAIQINATPQHSTFTPDATAKGSPQYHFSLIPLDPQECTQP